MILLQFVKMGRRKYFFPKKLGKKRNFYRSFMNQRKNSGEAT